MEVDEPSREVDDFRRRLAQLEFPVEERVAKSLGLSQVLGNLYAACDFVSVSGLPVVFDGGRVDKDVTLPFPKAWKKQDEARDYAKIPDKPNFLIAWSRVRTPVEDRTGLARVASLDGKTMEEAQIVNSWRVDGGENLPYELNAVLENTLDVAIWRARRKVYFVDYPRPSGVLPDCAPALHPDIVRRTWEGLLVPECIHVKSPKPGRGESEYVVTLYGRCGACGRQ
jgi:hypothetical protein